MSQSSADLDPLDSSEIKYFKIFDPTQFQPDLTVGISVECRFNDISRSVDLVLAGMLRYPMQSRCNYECMQSTPGKFEPVSWCSWTPHDPLTLTKAEYATLQKGIPDDKFMTIATRLWDSYYKEGVERLLSSQIQAPRGNRNSSCKSDLSQHTIALVDKWCYKKGIMTQSELLDCTIAPFESRALRISILPHVEGPGKTCAQMHSGRAPNWSNRKGLPVFYFHKDVPSSYAASRWPITVDKTNLTPEFQKEAEATIRSLMGLAGGAEIDSSNDLARTSIMREPSQVPAGDHPTPDVKWSEFLIDPDSDWENPKTGLPSNTN